MWKQFQEDPETRIRVGLMLGCIGLGVVTYLYGG